MLSVTLSHCLPSSCQCCTSTCSPFVSLQNAPFFWIFVSLFESFPLSFSSFLEYFCSRILFRVLHLCPPRYLGSAGWGNNFPFCGWCCCNVTTLSCSIWKIFIHGLQLSGFVDQPGADVFPIDVLIWHRSFAPVAGLSLAISIDATKLPIARESTNIVLIDRSASMIPASYLMCSSISSQRVVFLSGNNSYMLVIRLVMVFEPYRSLSLINIEYCSLTTERTTQKTWSPRTKTLIMLACGNCSGICSISVLYELHQLPSTFFNLEIFLGSFAVVAT